jgi:Kelch motif
LSTNYSYLCTIKKFIGPWESYTALPIPTVESQGGFIGGKNLVVFGGFSGAWSLVTNNTYTFDITNSTSTWRQLDSVPITLGLTHGGCASNGNIIYTCGGYMGGDPYPPTSQCFLLNPTNKAGTHWTALPNLPSLRSGGALLYDKLRNSLTFATGTNKHLLNTETEQVDHFDVWELRLNNILAGWKPRANIPYRGNHVGYTTVTYNGKQRHFVVGGQVGGQEWHGNIDSHYEYDSSNNVWIQRRSMPFPRGHISSSTFPYRNCGFLVAGGARNGQASTSDISYYSIYTDEWTNIGEIPEAVNSPVCGISQDYLYCQSGKLDQPYSWRRPLKPLPPVKKQQRTFMCWILPFLCRR